MPLTLPLTSTLARRQMEQTLIYKTIQGVRGRAAVDLDALEQLLVRFSQLSAEQSAITSIDINPLSASPTGLLALDARVILHEPATPPSRLDIRPYPTQYVWPWRDGITIRPIRPEDEPLIIAFHQGVSEHSAYLRYFHTMNVSARVSHDRLTCICFNNCDREIALVAEQVDPAPTILGVCCLTQKHGLPEAEFAMLAFDNHQRHRYCLSKLSGRHLNDC